MTKIGSGALTLVGSNTYGGGTTISAGTLQVGNGGGAGSIVGNVLDNASLAFSRSDTPTFSAAVSGSGGLTQMGPGTLILTGANTYGGGTTISGGTLQVGNGGVAGSIVGNVLDNAALAFSRSDTLTFGGAISGSGSLTQAGPGTLILTGANVFGGTTTISAGTLQIDNGGTTGSLGSGNVTNNAVLAFNRSDTYAFPGNIAGSGSLVMNGTGTLALAGTVASGAITVNQGQIIAGPGSMTTGNLTIPAAGRFTYSGSGLSVSNLSNSGTFVGGGQVIGNFVNASSGDVRIAGGQTLYLQNPAPQSNAGLIEVFGAAASQAQFESVGPFTNASGSMIAAQYATLRFDSGVTNQGSIAFSGGVNNVFGAVTNNPGGNITMTGGAAVTFYNNVVQNGTLNLSTVGGTSSAVFLGTLSGTGGITGGGEVVVMGDLHPGNSPGALAIHGNVYLAASTISDMQLTGTAAGSQYDQLNVTGTIALDGALSITLPNPGYRPTQGTQFQIMTFGSYTGAFTSMSGLDLGNRLQLVPAYTNNALTLTAVQGGSGAWNTDANGVISAAGNWANGVPGEAGDGATFGPVISAPRTVTVDVPTTFGSMTFQSSASYTIAGSNSLTLQVPGGSPQITVLAGSHTISAPWYWPETWRSARLPGIRWSYRAMSAVTPPR